MAINQSLIRDMRAYRAPYGSNRRSPSYTDPQTGAAKAPAPAATGALESRSVVRGPGIANDEMDESDDAEMVTQTQTPLTANARGPRYTEGSMMDLFTGQRTGTKNANYNADQPITDTNTPYLATKGFWGGLDRVLGNKSNELNEAAQQQQGAKWDTANKLKSSQDREDTVAKNNNTFTENRDKTLAGYASTAADVLAGTNKDAATALHGFNTTRDEAQAGYAREAASNLAGYNATRDDAQAGYAREAARVAQTNAVLNATTQDGFNKASALLLASARTEEQKNQIKASIDAAAAQNGFNVEANKTKVAAEIEAAGNIIHETPDGYYTQKGKLYKKNDEGKFVHVPLGAPPRSTPAKSNLNNVVPQAGQNNEQQAPASQAQPIAASDNSPVTRSARSSPEKTLEPGYSQIGRKVKALNNFLDDGRDARGRKITSEASKPAYLSSDNSFVGPSEVNPNAQSSESLGRERASRRTSEQLGLDYSEANPNAQSPENLRGESFQDQSRRSQEPLGESLKFPEGFDFNSQEANPKPPASSQGNNSQSLIKSLGSGVLRAGASVPKFLQDVHNLRIAEPHLDTMSGYSVTRDGRRIESPEIIQDSIRLGNQRSSEIMQSPEGQYKEDEMLEDQYDPRAVIPKEVNGRRRTSEEEQIRIDDEMLRRAKNSRKPSFRTK